MEYEIADNESLSMAVVDVVSAVEGRDPCSLQLLAEVLDPDALDALFDSKPHEIARSGGRLSFVYSESQVTIYNGEYLTVQLLDDRLTDGDPVRRCQ